MSATIEMGKQTATWLLLGLCAAVAGLLAEISSVEAAQPSAKNSAASGIVIKGVVTYRGTRPAPVAIVETGGKRERIEVDPKTHGLKDAVVYLEKPPATDSEPVKTLPVAQMDQREYVFLPHVLAIAAGQEVEFLNNDSPNHGVITTSLEPENTFNVLTQPGGSYRHRFVSDKRPIAVGCPLHSGMGAWICVFDHPFFAVTDSAGRFQIPPVPPGTCDLVVRHLDGSLRRTVSVDVAAGSDSDVRVDFTEKDLGGR